MALGGIGTGGFEIRQDGGFANWQIFNNRPQFAGAPYPFNPKQTLFFVLRVAVESEDPRLVLLQIEDGQGAAGIDHHEFQYIFPWLSGVDTVRLTASVPFADLEFEHSGVPLRIALRAWSSFIPGNVKDSALPLAFFDFTITSISDRPVDLEILASARNAVGYDQLDRTYRNRRVRDGAFSAVVMENDDLDPTASTTGSVTLASFDADTTAYLGWEHHHPYYERVLREPTLPEIEDTENRNRLDSTTGRHRADPRCFVTLGVRRPLARRGDTARHTFALAWHFPNNYAHAVDDPHIAAGYLEDAAFPGADPAASPDAEPPPEHEAAPLEGHYYENFFADSESVARYAQNEHDRLLDETTAFHLTFFDSSLPGFVLDQVNSHLNTFRTSTWLTRTGMFGILEGLSPQKSFAGIATTDVAMYGQIATSLLFPELDRMTVDLWIKFQNPDGSVVHSINCNSRHVTPKEASGHRLDMPAQFVFQALRAALWSGDDAYLARVWPPVKRALAYVLRERDANGDNLPDMRGIMCSYDNFPMHGVAPFVVTQWLAGVAAALMVARKLGDTEFVAEYEEKFESGRRTFEATTWNGDYFNLYSEPQDADPTGYRGCLTDQIIGEGAARQLGLPPVVDLGKAQTALRTILAMNYRPAQGLRNCQWPGDEFLHPVADATWVDQANTCWSGVELNFAAQLYQSGMPESAEEIIRNVDARHRDWGIYWDHQEFGGHYYRAMSALAIPNAFLGLTFDGETLDIAPALPLPIGRWCVLLPGAYGTLFRDARGGRLVIRSGQLTVTTIRLPFTGEVSVEGGGKTFSQREDAGRTVFTALA